MRGRPPAMDAATTSRFLRACADVELPGLVIAKRFGVTPKAVVDARRALGVRFTPMAVGDAFRSPVTFAERKARVRDE